MNELTLSTRNLWKVGLLHCYRRRPPGSRRHRSVSSRDILSFGFELVARRRLCGAWTVDRGYWIHAELSREVGRRSPGMVDRPRPRSARRIWFHELRYEGSPGLWHTHPVGCAAHFPCTLRGTGPSWAGIRDGRGGVPHLLRTVSPAGALAAGVQLFHGVPVRRDCSSLHLAAATLLPRGILLS